MARIYSQAYFRDTVVELEQAQVSVASSAVLYGLSVYTVFPVCRDSHGDLYAFRLPDHYQRLVNSARIIGINTFEPEWSLQKFSEAMRALLAANAPHEDVFVRVSVHVPGLLPGIRTRDLESVLSAFVYEAQPILPQGGARLKTSVWRRTPDNSIPSRAKVNGAYVNSVLAKQDALDSGYDDCILLDSSGHVCELSAANICVVRDGVLITPGVSSDILEGISRRSIIEIAHEEGIEVIERPIDLTELYVADEIFACGTSAFISPVTMIDARTIGTGTAGPLTLRLRERYTQVQHNADPLSMRYLTKISTGIISDAGRAKEESSAQS